MLRAEDINLITFPLASGNSFNIYAQIKNKCSLNDAVISKTTTSKSFDNNNGFIEKLNAIQRELNLKIYQQYLVDDHLFVSMNGARNLIFEFYFDKDKCELIRRIHFNQDVFTYDTIEVGYITAIYSPVVHKILFLNSKSLQSYTIYPWALENNIAIYELQIGFALNFHSNIRPDNLNDFEKSDPSLVPIPAFLFRYGPIFINKDGAGSLIYHSENFTLLALGVLEGEPYQTKTLNERHQGVFLGGLLKYDPFKILYYNDFFNNKGFNIKGSIDTDILIKYDWKITPQIYIQFWNKNYVNYYFGVTANETSSRFPIYQTSSTLNYGSSMEFAHNKENWTFVEKIEFKQYGSEVYNSPTVIKKAEGKIFSSVLYKFF